MLEVWFFLLIGAIAIEVLTPSALVAIWFAIGALVGMILAALQVNVTMQWISVITVSIISMLCIRPLAKKSLRGNVIATNSDRLIGEVLVLTKAITKDMWGEVKHNGAYWHVVHVDGLELDEGSKVKVLSIDGAKLIVREID